MAFTTPNMSLKVWNLLSDPYDHQQLAGNFVKLDLHDHGANGGAQISTAGIADGSITGAKMATGSLTGTNIADGSLDGSELAAGAVTNAKIGTGAVAADNLDATTITTKLGLSGQSVTRRGKSIITASESRTNTAYGLMTTPDRVTGIVLPTDGLIAIGYQATWQESVAGASRAAVFIGANQLKVSNAGFTSPGTQAAATNASVAAADRSLTMTAAGLVSNTQNSAYTGDVTTGQLLGNAGTSGGGNLIAEVGGTVSTFGSQLIGGPCFVFAAAGTYDISIQFKASSGSVTVRDRKLWVWTLGF
jgi:hypothetical protein